MYTFFMDMAEAGNVPCNKLYDVSIEWRWCNISKVNIERKQKLIVIKIIQTHSNVQELDVD